MPVKLSIVLELECSGEREAGALESTMSPDNASVPRDQRFTAARRGSSLRFEVESARPAGALSSVVSLLTDAKLFQDVWMVAP
jgi:hypothetical protein